MEVLKSLSKELVLDCLSLIGFELPSRVIVNRQRKFEFKVKDIDNSA
jgi:hypothetical protein